jgi:bacterioferritin-associated ferredoxin
MFVCHCRAVSDTVIRDHIACGVSCPDEIAMRCGAGADCGSCLPLIADLLAESGLAGVGVDIRLEVA